MPPTPDEIRTDMLRTKLERTIRNVSEWWGITPDQAATVLDGLRDQVSRHRSIGGHPWPDPGRARFDPGTPDANLREMAYEGAAAIAAQGVRPSQRNVWAWCKARGARKRHAMALRIIGGVVAVLSAREVAATYVRGV
jgi:predicted Fe-S protein YdhL (DUF1289 family)